MCDVFTNSNISLLRIIRTDVIGCLIMAEVGEQRQGGGEEEGGAREENGAALLGPRDEIKISVKQFQKSDNDQTYVYDIEVVPRPPCT